MLGQDWERSVFISMPEKSSAKECSNYCTIAPISHASKVMLKILQARLQQYINRDLPDVQSRLEKAEEPEINCQHLLDHRKVKEFQKNTYFCNSLTMLKSLTVKITTNCGKFLKRWEYQTISLAFWEICMKVKKKQNWTWNNKLVPNWKKEYASRLYIVTPLT